MRKTFWSVKYSVWGADRPRIAWFDNKADADTFARRDYTDKPISHTYSNAAKIAEAQELVTQFNLN